MRQRMEVWARESEELGGPGITVRGWENDWESRSNGEELVGGGYPRGRARNEAALPRSHSASARCGSTSCSATTGSEED